MYATCRGKKLCAGSKPGFEERARQIGSPAGRVFSLCLSRAGAVWSSTTVSKGAAIAAALATLQIALPAERTAGGRTVGGRTVSEKNCWRKDQGRSQKPLASASNVDRAGEPKHILEKPPTRGKQTVVPFFSNLLKRYEIREVVRGTSPYGQTSLEAEL